MDDKLTHIILTDHALRYGLDGKSAYEIAQKYGYEGTEPGICRRTCHRKRQS